LSSDVCLLAVNFQLSAISFGCFQGTALAPFV
jgi:hypothetical protein